MRAERITDSVTYHGEGPVWWVATGELRFVDMLHGAVVALAESGATHRLPVGSPVAAVIRPRTGGGAIVARERDIALARSEDLSDLAPVTPDFVPKGQRLNEGGCDPLGRFLVGGMAYARTPGASNVWRLDGDAAGSGVVTPAVASGGARTVRGRTTSTPRRGRSRCSTSPPPATSPTAGPGWSCPRTRATRTA